MPTFADSKSIATSGASPARIAATIFVVSMFPETSTVTPGCFASYSPITRFMTPSSRAVNGSQTLSFAGFAAPAAVIADPADTATIRTSTPSLRIFLPASKLVRFPNETLR